MFSAELAIGRRGETDRPASGRAAANHDDGRHTGI